MSTTMKLILILMLFTFSIQAQKKVSIALYQDAKLATFGDSKHGYEAFTINVISRFKMQGHQQKYGYMIIFPEFEYAEIEGVYRRYSLNVGYAFNKLMLNKFEASFQGGWGFIERYSATTFSAAVSGELAYKITDNFKLAILAQFTDRTDLKLLYGNSVFRFSGFIGIEYNLN